MNRESKSITHRQGPFHIFFGSYDNAFKTIANELKAQKEGSLCVTNCSDNAKYDSIPPSSSDSLNNNLPEYINKRVFECE